MKPPLSDELRVRHVPDAIKEIESYLQYVSEEGFLSNSEKRFATIKQIEIIGEACARITPDIKERYPDVEWKNALAAEPDANAVRKGNAGKHRPRCPARGHPHDPQPGDPRQD